MKILIRDYLASLREREELDAILPDLLSELGFNVYSKPRRGTLQRGVDIAAVGIDEEDGERKVFLFTVKQGDLTRQEWDGTPQALRSSLDEIVDVYIRNRIPERFRNMKVVICLAFGGEVHEQVRENLVAFIERNTTDRIRFDEWNGDRIAGLLLQGILKEELLPKELRSHFQKSVAMVDEPDVSYEHFSALVDKLVKVAQLGKKERLRSSRQLYICLWILYVWARDLGNTEAAIRCSRIALLAMWTLGKDVPVKQRALRKQLSAVFEKTVWLHVQVQLDQLERRVLPFSKIPYGVSFSIPSRSALDINLALFEVLARIGLAGTWLVWVHERTGDNETVKRTIRHLVESGLDLIAANSMLHHPYSDRQAANVAIFLQLWLSDPVRQGEVRNWLEGMAKRIIFTVKTGANFPISSSDYRDLVEHIEGDGPKDLKSLLPGSVLIPQLGAWLYALGSNEGFEALAKLVRDELPDCNLQHWLPNGASEDRIYLNVDAHGAALSHLSLEAGGQRLLQTFRHACDQVQDWNSLSAIAAGHWPLVLVACHHHELPIPPQFWISSLTKADEAK